MDFTTKLQKKGHCDVATSVPNVQGRHNFRAFEKIWEPTKAEKRRRKKTISSREDGARKRSTGSQTERKMQVV